MSHYCLIIRLQPTLRVSISDIKSLMGNGARGLRGDVVGGLIGRERARPVVSRYTAGKVML